MTTARQLLTLTTFFLILLVGAGCAVAPPTDNLRREIRFGVEADVSPLKLRDAQGELAGLNIECYAQSHP